MVNSIRLVFTLRVYSIVENLAIFYIMGKIFYL